MGWMIQNAAMKFLLTLLSVCLLSTISVQGKGKKRSPISITFHFEATGIEGKKFAVPVETRLGKRFIQKVPTLSTKDFIAYYPFVSPHPDGEYGVSLQLNRTAAKRLSMLSAESKGRYIVVNINGKVVDMLFIDKQVDGRVITIWRGIDANFIAYVNPIMPKIGEEPKVWKARIKKEKKKKK